MNLRTKTTLCLLLAGCITGITAYGVAYSSAETILINNHMEKLTAIRENKIRLVDDYYRGLKRQIFTLAQSPTAKKAARDFAVAFRDYVRSGADSQQQIDRNRQSLSALYGETSQSPDSSSTLQGEMTLRISPKGAAYHNVHENYHDFFDTYASGSELEDLLLVDPYTTDIIYSYRKKKSFAQHLLSDVSPDSQLARAIVKIRNSIDHYMVEFVDFYRYDSREASAFLATPIYEKGKEVAILLFQLSQKQLEQTLSGNNNWQEEGLGGTGESYIVGQDYKMRTNSRSFVEDPDKYLQEMKQVGMDNQVAQAIEANGSSVLLQRVDTEAAIEALQMRKGTKRIKSYLGTQVLSSYAPIKVDDMEWALLTEITLDEVNEPIKDLNHRMIIGLSLLFIPLMLLAGAISNRLLNPLHRLTSAMEKLGQGVFSQRVDVTTQDEIGELARFFNHTAAELERMKMSVQNYSQKQENLEEQIEEITYLYAVDALTGIYNRRRFEESLKEVIDSNKEVPSANVVALFDIDHFKEINDTFGHDFGDRTLLSVTKIVQRNQREHDVFARWGGDEFILLLPDIKLSAAQILIDKIRQEIENSPEVKSAFVTCSFGLTEIEETDSLKSVFKRVDLALYDAKEAGRNCVKSRSKQDTMT